MLTLWKLLPNLQRFTGTMLVISCANVGDIEHFISTDVQKICDKHAPIACKRVIRKRVPLVNIVTNYKLHLKYRHVVENEG